MPAATRRRRLDLATGRHADITARHLLLIRLIPRAPRWTDVAQLLEQFELANQGITKRCMQRDLALLEARMPQLECRRESKPYRYAWAIHTQTWWHGMDHATAFVLALADRLGPLVPGELRRIHAQAFAEAKRVLARAPEGKLARWLELVASLVPRPDGPAAEAVMQALFARGDVRVEIDAEGGPAQLVLVPRPGPVKAQLTLVERDGGERGLKVTLG
jgi:hypothetical protein